MSLNKIMLIGRVGKEPETKTLPSGGKVASFSLATSEKWKDKDGQKQERTEWHNIVIYNEGLVNVVASYVKKGSQIYVSGKSVTRKWQDKSGVDKYTTEVVLRGFDAELKLLDSNKQQTKEQTEELPQDAVAAGIDDDIPF